MSKTSNRNGFSALLVLGFIALGCAGVNDLANLGGNGNVSRTSDSSSNYNTNAQPPIPTDDVSDDLFDVKQEDGETFPQNPNMKEIARVTTKDLANAYITGDFSDLHSKMVPELREKATEADVKTTYERVKDARLTTSMLSQLIASEPQISKLSGVSTTVNVNTGKKTEYVMRIEGEYAVNPEPISFKYDYHASSGKWRVKALILGRLDKSKLN